MEKENRNQDVSRYSIARRITSGHGPSDAPKERLPLCVKYRASMRKGTGQIELVH